jgi:hypothetical protein
MPRDLLRVGQSPAVFPINSDAGRPKRVTANFFPAVHGCLQLQRKLFSPWQHRPSSKGSGKTSLVEGLNNKWRNRVSGLVRKTVCVQSLDDLERRLWLVMENHNQLCIIQLEKLLDTH